MKVKEKSHRRKKSVIEKKYEQFFSFLNCDVMPIEEIITRQTPQQKPQLRTWVTYGAFEDPII